MRACGILLHISALPNEYGIGSLGKTSYNFIDFLSETGQTYWQVLPIGPTSYGDSPYQTFSAFASNPYFIDLDILKNEKLLTEEELLSSKVNNLKVNYEWLYNTRFEILKKAYQRFSLEQEEFKNFIKKNDYWLPDYSLFMTLKTKFNGISWNKWPKDYKFRNPDVLNIFINENKDEINFWNFIQYQFFKQWDKLKKYAAKSNIKIIGDIPIYVAYDSSDVWANPNLWIIDENLEPTIGAGVPPDYFSETGQMWGNPIYNYRLMKQNNYKWWVDRIEQSLNLFDYVRIDHFRGFEAYYTIPKKAENAINGKWIKGPGMNLFNAVKAKLGDVNIIAEDLGLITPEVKQLLKKTGFPGMNVLQFAFNPNDNSGYLPHNHKKNSVTYTGTHDNMPLKEWLEQLQSEEKQFCYKYCDINNDKEAINKIICIALNSISDTVIIPLVDYLELGEEARFNTPSTVVNNWTWRLNSNLITKDLKNRILKNTILSKRIVKMN